MPPQLQLVAHRGGSALAPQNTLAAFRNSLHYPIYAFELDVQMSRDGQAIVFHDNTVEKLTDGVGNVLDLDFTYLRGLDAAAHFPGGWPDAQRIPTLRESLDVAQVQRQVQVYIEIKESKRNADSGRYPGIAEAVIEDVRAMGMLKRVLIMSFDWSVLPEVKALEPGVQVGALVSSDIFDFQVEGAFSALSEQVLAHGWDWINMDCKLFSPQMPGIAHANGLRLGLWTVNTLQDMRRFAETGVDSLTSDHPELFDTL